MRLALPDETLRGGPYALVLSADSNRQICVGKLGTLQMCPGFYVYVGSALGPGGVRARLAHHLRPTDRPHWHIDYLRAHTQVEEIWYCLDASRREHTWAQRMGTAVGASIPLKGFGSSDCNCEAHLFFFEARPAHHRFQRVLGNDVGYAVCNAV